MKKLALIASVFCAALPLSTHAAGAIPALHQPWAPPNPGIVPTSPPLLKALYSQLTACWWQWALAQSPEHFPILDPTGANQQYGQSGPVWFLAGNFGGTDVRNVTIPRGKFVFFPVINSEWDTVPGFPNPLNLPDPLSVADIRAITAHMINGNISTCTIDGRTVSNIQQFRVRSPVFSIDIHPELAPLLGYPVTHVQTAVSDGVWLLLTPLSRGQHTLRFTASSPLGFTLDMTYHITVP